MLNLSKTSTCIASPHEHNQSLLLLAVRFVLLASACCFDSQQLQIVPYSAGPLTCTGHPLVSSCC
jgi:hypothetical protein